MRWQEQKEQSAELQEQRRQQLEQSIRKGQQEVRRIRLVDRKVFEQEVILKNIGRVRDVAAGPDGLVYVVLNKPDRIVRLVPADK